MKQQRMESLHLKYKHCILLRSNLEIGTLKIVILRLIIFNRVQAFVQYWYGIEKVF